MEAAEGQAGAERGDLGFPVFRLSCIAVVSVAALAWLALTSIDVYRAKHETRESILELQELRGTIVHLDEVLTMSARMAARTGELRWERRYLGFEPKLDEAIKRSRALAPREYTRATDTANIALVAIEKLSFERVRQNRLADAWALLTSPEYEEHKRLYAGGMQRLADELDRVGEEIVAQDREGDRRTIAFALALVLGLAVTWPVVVRMLLRSRALLLREIRARAKAQVALEDASRTKSQFLANMSHEIRTPMTAILGYTDELLGDGALAPIPSEPLDALEAIKRNGRHLLGIINDILDLSKIEAGRLEIERLPVSPIEIVQDVRSLVQVSANEKQLEIEVEFATPVPDTIETDPTRLRQILINLVANAIKFTRTGTIRLVTRVLADESNARIQFEVRDPGIGMRPDQISRLFQPFTQADSSTTREYGGTGLGLSICQRLLEQMSGEIEVESEPGRGSTFRVTLPLGSIEGAAMIDAADAATAGRRDVEPKGELAAQPSLSECRILLAEDSRDGRHLIRRILERAGARVATAVNGRLALQDALAAREAGEAFDVILMDIQMPVLDGIGATRALRRAGYEGSIIALTANAMSEDRELCLGSGCDDFATKPIDRGDLLAKIAAVLAKR